MRILLIAVAGGFGTVSRYLVGGWVQRLLPSTFPLGTFVVNVAGCLLVGFLAAALSGRILVREELRLAVTIGFLGGFTTFSTFGLETFAFLNDGQLVRAGLNVLCSVGAGVTAVWAGYRLAENWLGA